VIVVDQVEIQAFGDGLVNGGRELLELHRPVLAMEFAPRGFVGDVWRGVWVSHAVWHVTKTGEPESVPLIRALYGRYPFDLIWYAGLISMRLPCFAQRVI